MKKRIVVILAMAVLVVTVLAAPVFAQGVGGCDPQPGQTERTDAPPQGHPGAIHSDNPQSAGATGFGRRVDECA